MKIVPRSRTTIFSYGNDPAHLDMLRSGKIDAMMSFPPYSQQLEQEGFPILADPTVEFPGGRPEKVTVATGRTIDLLPHLGTSSLQRLVKR